jgi:PKHD-type hydroxylase C-terminal domain
MIQGGWVTSALLFKLDNALKQFGRDAPGHPALVDMIAVYHNLLRLWSDTGPKRRRAAGAYRSEIGMRKRNSEA